MRALLFVLVPLLCVSKVLSQAEDRIRWINYMQRTVLNETTPIGTVVYTLLAIDTQTGSSENMIYGFNDNLDATSIDQDNTYLFVNQTTGAVSILSTIDFETVEIRTITCNFIAKIVGVTEGKVVTTSVAILNENDTPPSFVVQGSGLKSNVTENSTIPVGGELLINNITVLDPDNVVTGQDFVFVTITACFFNKERNEECLTWFELRNIADSIDVGARYLNLILNTTVDYERTGVITLNLQADDGVAKKNTDVVITVLDIQDQPPVWIILPSNSPVQDDTPAGGVSILVSARDGDSEKIRRNVSYALVPGVTNNSVPIDNYWVIDFYSGIITNKIPIDLEDPIWNVNGRPLLTWSLAVQACELLNETQPSDLYDDCTSVETFFITISDVNDNGPRFLIDNYVYTVRENVQNGYTLLDPSIQVRDNDTEAFNRYNVSFTQESLEFGLIGASSTPIITVRNTTLIDYDTGPREYFLTLIAVDQQNSSFTDLAQVTIRILDVNDNAPVLTEAVYFGVINETAQDFETVPLTPPIEATDLDSGFYGKEGIRFSLSGSGAELFIINQLTGVVNVAPCLAPNERGQSPCLDYETKRQYDLVVTATDSSLRPAESLKGTAQLRIQILNRNDNLPRVRNYERTIVEGQTDFDFPLIVQGTDADNEALQYTIIPSQQSQLWQVNQTTGRITLNKGGQPVLFDDSFDGQFTFLVDVSDGTFQAVPPSTVTINVQDINNNVPLFVPSYYTKSINESTTGGVSLLTVTARDADDPTTNNGQFEFRIDQGGGGLFTVNSTTGVFSTGPRATFDFSAVNFYRITVLVVDQGSPSLSSTGTVDINILDVNNKDPFITPSSQTFTVEEDKPVRHIVGTVGFGDPDDNPDLRFRFVPPYESVNVQNFPTDINVYNYTNTFAVDPFTGTLRVNGKLNHTLAFIISYGIEVEDLNAAPGSPRQIGTGRVVFYVLEINSGGPTIIDPITNVTLSEERPSGTVVLTLNARDDDGIAEFLLPPSLQPVLPYDYKFFAISSTGSVQIIGRIDYDDVFRLNETFFVVTVSDRGEPQLTTTLTVTVYFRNENDNFPSFVQSRQDLTPVRFYSTRVRENTGDGISLLNVFAIDNDRPEPTNSFYVVNYFMNDDRFDVDPVTGEIFVRLRNNATLDREVNSILLTEVLARDNPGGSPQNQRAATVQIILEDENDNPPIFTRLVYTATIFDTIDVGTSFLQLFITDLDIGDFGRSIFRKRAGDTEFFDVNREFGSIFVNKSLDGFPGFYTFVVEAVDNLGRAPSNIAEATVIVEVIRSRNEPPIWVIPPLANMTINVLEEQYYGMIIYDVLADDPDTGNNGVVDYSFNYEGTTTQNTPEFSINPITGVISANITYDRERISRYVLLLQARDRGETSLESQRFLTINIKDVNDNVPTFAVDEVDFTVNEDVGIGFSVGSVTATDLDLNPVIVYRILSGNEDMVFRLDENTGEIFTLKALDTEQKSIYYLSIQASNNEPDYTVIRNRRRRAVDPSIITVRIRVGDINDLAPVFLDDNYYGCISTRSEYGKSILTIRAVDRDAVGTSIVKFSLNNTVGGFGSSDKSNYFAIDEDFGIITNTILMRSQADATFDLTVNARDGEDPATSESSNTNVKIFVTQPGKEVKLVITQNTAEVRLYQSQIQRIVEQSEFIDYLCIVDIQDHVVDSVGATTTLWSDVYVSGVKVRDDGSNRILGSRELMNIIDTERIDRGDDFDLLYIKDVEAASSSEELELDDKAVIIILIIIAVLIFLVIIFCIVAFMCIKAAKTQKKRILVHKTNSPPPPAPVIMAVQEPEPEPVIYDNRGFIQDVEPPIIQEQEVISPEPVHVQYAVVQKRAPSPVVYETEYQTEPVDDEEVIVVPLDVGEPQVSVYETQPEPENEYRIETEVVQD